MQTTTHEIARNTRTRECRCSRYRCPKYACCIITCICIVVLILSAVLLAYYTLPGCFSADSMVWLQKNSDMSGNIGSIQYSKLREIDVGDRVLNVDPWTGAFSWDEVQARVHFSWLDNAHSVLPMRTLFLQTTENVTQVSSVSKGITLSSDHLVFIRDKDTGDPIVIKAEMVKVGDELYYCDIHLQFSTNVSANIQVLPVTAIVENVLQEYRAIFVSSRYLMVDGIVASPYAVPHPIYEIALHHLFSNDIFMVFQTYAHPMLFSFVIYFGYYAMYGSFYFTVHWMCMLSILMGIMVISDFYHSDIWNFAIIPNWWAIISPMLHNFVKKF